MATLAIGAAAAYLAPVGYGAIAFSVASSAAAYMLAPKLPTIEGPRLNDLKAQSSNYGDMLPIVFGTARLAGKMIWSKPILETKHSESAGGKGGGGQTVNSYSYSQTFAIAICEGPIAGIRRIWANGELIYNVASDVDAQTIIASHKRTGGWFGNLAGVVGSVVGNSGMVIYLGTETQTPDATIQADVGVANCPAYRGTAYVVFNNLQLEKYGNRTPNLEFEVCTTSGAVTFNVMNLAYWPQIVTAYDGHVWQKGGFRWVGTSGGDLIRISNYTGAVSALFDASAYQIVNTTSDLNGNPFVWTWASPKLYKLSESGGLTLIGGVSQWPYGHGLPYEIDNNFVIWMSGGNKVQTTVPGSNEITLWDAGSTYTAYTEILYNRYGGGRVFLRLQRASDGTSWIAELHFDGTGIELLLDVTATLGSPQGSICVFLIGSANGDLIFGGQSIYTNNYIYKYDIATNEVTSVLVHAAWGTANPCEMKQGLLMVSRAQYVSVVDLVNMTELAHGNVSPFLELSKNLDLDGNAYGELDANPSQVVLVNYSGITPTAVTLATITGSIATRVGLVAGDLNVTALTDDVDGYVIGRRMTARAALEPLMGAFYFDGVESDAKIKFVKRGGASAVSIAEDDLACHQAGEAMPDPIRMTRAQEMDLPREVSVSYIDADAAYQTGTQYDRRLITSSQKKDDYQFAISMSATKAKQIASVALFNAWAERNSAPIVTSRKYAFYEPTDIITVTQGNVSWIVRVLEKNERDGMIEWKVVAEQSAVYTQAATAVALPSPALTVDMEGPTQLTLLDIPLLRDQDDGFGFYAAVSGYTSGWTGAQLFKSNDGELSWQITGDGFFAAANQGYAETALGNFSGGNIFDELNTVSVVMSATLSSISELAVLNGGNAILIGDEILQFKTATLSAANTYTLTGLLRGRRGTEWAMSMHAIGDRVVLLTSTTIYRMPDASAELNLARDWRAVSFGNYIDEAETVEFTDTGVGLECYSPVQIGGGRDASGNLTITWKRRTRIGGEWRDYVDASLGEAVEAYEIELYNAGFTTLIGTVASATTSAVITPASFNLAGSLQPADADAAWTAMLPYIKNYKGSGPGTSFQQVGTRWIGLSNDTLMAIRAISVTSAGAVTVGEMTWGANYSATVITDPFSIKVSPTAGWSVIEDGSPGTSELTNYVGDYSPVIDHRDSADNLLMSGGTEFRLSYIPSGGSARAIYCYKSYLAVIPRTSIDSGTITIASSLIRDKFFGMPSQFDSLSDNSYSFVADPYYELSPRCPLSVIAYGALIYVVIIDGIATYSTSGKAVDITNLLNGHLAISSTVGLRTYRFTISGNVISALDDRTGWYLSDRVNSTQGVEVVGTTAHLINMTTGATDSTFSVSAGTVLLAGDWAVGYFYTCDTSGNIRKYSTTGTLIATLATSLSADLSIVAPGIESLMVSADQVYLKTQQYTYSVDKNLSSFSMLVDSDGRPLTVSAVRPDSPNVISKKIIEQPGDVSALSTQLSTATIPNPAGVKVYQLSANVGRGYPGSATV